MGPSVAQNKQAVTEIDNAEIESLEQNAADQANHSFTTYVSLVGYSDLNFSGITSNTPKPSTTHVYLKYISLIIYTLQNVVRLTLIRYTNTQSGPRHIKSTFVFICEIQKTIFSIFLIFGQERNIITALKKVFRAFLKEPYITSQLCLIALVYNIQNNLNLIAVSKLDIATYAVTNQLKILTTAIFTRVLLSRRLNIIQWFALILLIIGISLVEIENITSKKVKKDVEPVMGFIAVVICCICSGFAGVYFEKIVKKNTETSLWIYNIQLATFSIILSALVMYIMDGSDVKNRGIFYGYTKLVWLSTILNSIGGLIVALVIKYSDNILKGFASASSVVLSCIIAIIFFAFQLTVLFSIGSLLVILSIIIYSNPDLIRSIPILKLVFKDKPVFV